MCFYGEHTSKDKGHQAFGEQSNNGWQAFVARVLTIMVRACEVIADDKRGRSYPVRRLRGKYIDNRATPQPFLLFQLIPPAKLKGCVTLAPPEILMIFARPLYS